MNSQINLRGCELVQSEIYKDRRGYFRRMADSSWLSVKIDFKQISISHNKLAYTLRGLHFQLSKDSEYKIVSVLSGSIYDVILDLRPGSTTYLQHRSFIFQERSNQSLIIAPGIAHGFMTLEPNSIVHYAMTSTFDAKNYGGIRWNDPKISIEWPEKPTIISKQDQNWPDLC